MKRSGSVIFLQQAEEGEEKEVRFQNQRSNTTQGNVGQEG